MLGLVTVAGFKLKDYSQTRKERKLQSREPRAVMPPRENKNSKKEKKMQDGTLVRICSRSESLSSTFGPT
jgi:hypothetical protein